MSDIYSRKSLFSELKYTFDRYAEKTPELAISIALTQVKLHKAVSEENYELAAICRDKLNEYYACDDAKLSLTYIEDLIG